MILKNNRKFKPHKIWWLMLIIVICVIFIFSNQPGVKSTDLSDSVAHMLDLKTAEETGGTMDPPLFAGLSLRKYAHIVLYALMGVLSYLAVKDSLQNSWQRLLASGILCYALACFDEFHQYFIPGRTASIRDTLIDAVGFVPAILICWGIIEIRRRSRLRN